MFYQAQDLDMCVAIISLDSRVNEIKKTHKRIEFLSKNYPSIIVVPEHSKIDITDINIDNTPLFRGGNCITSMFDIAIENSMKPWVYLIFAGTTILQKIDVKLSRYVDSEKDVLFPVVDRIWNFVDGSINGILINQKFHASVGHFGSGNPLKVTKLNWADRALQQGVRFKAIVGAFSI